MGESVLFLGGHRLARAVTSGYGAETFLLGTTDIGAGGETGEAQQSDKREGLSNGHGNLGRKGKPNGTHPIGGRHAHFLT